MRGFESQLYRLVFKNTWTEFGEHNILCLPQLILTHRDSCQITKTKRTNRLAKVSRLGKQPIFQSFRIILEAIRMARYITFFYESHWSKSSLKNCSLVLWPKFSATKLSFFNGRFSKKKFFPKFLFCSVSLYESSNRLLRKTWNFSETKWSIKRFELVLFWN